MPDWLEKIATSDRLLYRRGNFTGPMDQMICDALRGEFDCHIALSPGFRWGTTALAGQPLTMEDVLAETAISYPETYLQSMTGSQIKDVLEDICDNLFNADPYHQQGGDMVRTGGLSYACTPAEAIGRRISPISCLITVKDSRPTGPTRLQDGRRSIHRPVRRCGMSSSAICVRAGARRRRAAASSR